MKITTKYSWHIGSWATVQQNLLNECSDLYSNHYGYWSKNSPQLPGKRIQLSPEWIAKWLNLQGARLYCARLNDELIGYAITSIEKVKNYGQIAWVTQLVVHENYRHQGIGKNLLFSIWRFSNYFAWGILTSSPYAVRALEKATRRRCTPQRIKKNKRMLLNFGRKNVHYVTNDMEVVVKADSSVANTNFFADHSRLDEMINNVISEEAPWTLGELDEGWEWFAFTFNDQQQLELTSQEIEDMLNASDQVTRQAYSRMQLDSSHLWAKHADSEIEFIVDQFNIKNNHTVLDLGCGKGRHSLALAKKGLDVVGIDYNNNLIEFAKNEASKLGDMNPKFLQGDCRYIELHEVFDVVICIYDVVGSYVDNTENVKILKTISNHLKKGGCAIISVMNYELSKFKATKTFSLKNEANKLLELPASQTMEKTGDIFDPEYYIIDTDTGIIYRKEQFLEGSSIPEEFIVRDKRFTNEEITNLCLDVGLKVLKTQYVCAGKWDTPLAAHHDKAKEILLVCEKT